MSNELEKAYVWGDVGEIFDRNKFVEDYRSFAIIDDISSWVDTSKLPELLQKPWAFRGDSIIHQFEADLTRYYVPASRIIETFEYTMPMLLGTGAAIYVGSEVGKAVEAIVGKLQALAGGADVRGFWKAPLFLVKHSLGLDENLVGKASVVTFPYVHFGTPQQALEIMTKFSYLDGAEISNAKWVEAMESRLKEKKNG